MSLSDKTKMIKYALSEFKKATHMNNAQLGALLTSPSSIRTKIATDAIAVPIKSWLNTKIKSKAGKAILAKIPANKFGTALMYVDAANAGTQLLRDFLPTVAETADWTMALPFNVLNQTLGRIPGLGAFFRAIHNFVTEGVSKVADFFGLDSLAETGKTLVLDDPDKGFETNIQWHKNNSKGDDNMPQTTNKTTSIMKNHPRFYENLDLHKTFNVPGAYTKKTVVNGTLATPKIVAHHVSENPIPDISALVDRLNQKFSLIKAVRGLSATQYNLIDLANYERYAKINLLEYYVLKKVVKAAKTYNLVQTAIGDNIIDSLGFDPIEVRTNLANYETLLCQWHRFITNNIPMNGTWIERLEYLVGVNIPDYSDQKVATIHMFSISMGSVFSDDNTSFVFDCIPGVRNNSYAVMLNNFNSLQAAIVNNTKWQQLIADYFGAFGAKCMWSDKEYPSYQLPLDLRNGDNDLNREQVKNAFYMNAKLELITIDPNTGNKKYRVDGDGAEAFLMPNYTFGSTFNAAAVAGTVSPTYSTILNGDTYLRVNTPSVALAGLGTNNKVLIPDMNGVGAQVLNATPNSYDYVDMGNHETIYTLHKDSYSEGEALEISQFKCRCIGFQSLISDSNDFFEAFLYFKTQEYALIESHVYTFGSSGSNVVDQRYILCNEVVSDDDLQDTESPVDYPDEIMCWALIDWMPLAHFTFFSFNSNDNSYSPRDIALIDMDAFGSLDDRAFATSVNYSIYSLQGANLRIDGKTKRISNLADVYKDKPSKRG